MYKEAEPTPLLFLITVAQLYFTCNLNLADSEVRLFCWSSSINRLSYLKSFYLFKQTHFCSYFIHEPFSLNSPNISIIHFLSQLSLIKCPSNQYFLLIEKDWTVFFLMIHHICLWNSLLFLQTKRTLKLFNPSKSLSLMVWNSEPY